MNYFDYVKEVAEYREVVELRTDMLTLHNAYDELLKAEGLDQLSDIRGILIMDNEDTKAAIENLVAACLNGYKVKHDLNNSEFIVNGFNYKVSRYGSTQRNISIDITLLCKHGIAESARMETFKDDLTSDQQHRQYT